MCIIELQMVVTTYTYNMYATIKQENIQCHVVSNFTRYLYYINIVYKDFFCFNLFRKRKFICHLCCVVCSAYLTRN